MFTLSSTCILLNFLAILRLCMDKCLLEIEYSHGQLFASSWVNGGLAMKHRCILRWGEGVMDINIKWSEKTLASCHVIGNGRVDHIMKL